MKRVCLIGVVAMALVGNARADEAATTRAEIQKQLGFVPEIAKAIPDAMLPGAWRELTTLQMNPNTALPGKVKELIGLAVASQIPCTYCIYGHTELAKLNGASDVEIGEAIGMAALTRHWSAFVNGAELDGAKLRADLTRIVDAAKKAAPGAPPRKPMVLTDAASALKDIEQTFGFVPELFKPVPPDALPGAWQVMRDLELSPTTALSNKYKSLIGLAVASQIPCSYCVAETTFARLAGASDAELHEAVAMAALVRQFSTLLNGRQVDLAAFKRDIRRLVAQAKQPAKHAAR